MSKTRSLSHERVITYKSFERSDGLFDIEGELRDSKGYPYTDWEREHVPAGMPLHDIFATITIDEDLTIHDFRYEMRTTPFSVCQATADTSQLIGVSILRSWRSGVREAFGTSGGCTHLRELVLGMGTVAFQTISPLQDRRLHEKGISDDKRTEIPRYLGGCHALRFDGPIVEKYFPQFFRERGGSDQAENK